MPAHKIEWVDGKTIELESSTHTETGLRLVFKDERIFEVDVVEPISTHKRWKTFKLVCVCKAVETEIGELVPCPTSSWGKRVEKLWKPKVQKGEEREVTELVVIEFSGFELNKSGGLEQQSITHFALFESTQDRQLIVGVRNVRESQPQKDELHSQIQGEVIRLGDEMRKHAEEVGHSLDKLKDTIKQADSPTTEQFSDLQSKIEESLKLQRESKEQFAPLESHLHAIFTFLRKLVRKQAASKGGVARGRKNKIKIMADELATMGPPELLENRRTQLTNIPEPYFFQHLLGRICGEHWADEFFTGKIKSGAVSSETVRRWSRTLETHPPVALFLVKFQEDLIKSSVDDDAVIDKTELKQGYGTVSNP